MIKRLQSLFFGFVMLLAAIGSAHATSMSDYLENALINHVFRATAYSAPATLYVGLSTTSCSDSSTGTEVSGGSYARVAVTSSTSNWDATSGTDGTTANTNAITFPAPTANWGTVVAFFISDASSAGNMLVCQALTTSKTVNNGDAAPSFAAGALTFQIDN